MAVTGRVWRRGVAGWNMRLSWLGIRLTRSVVRVGPQAASISVPGVSAQAPRGATLPAGAGVVPSLRPTCGVHYQARRAGKGSPGYPAKAALLRTRGYP